MLKQSGNKFQMLILLVGLIALSGCAGVQGVPEVSTLPEADSSLRVTDGEPSEIDTVVEPSKSDNLGSESLTEVEAEGLKFMREEEKLAHDLYLAFSEMWGLPIFSNIARSETVHMDSVKSLLDKYGIADPAEGNPDGVFTDPDLQTLYDQLLADGSGSVVDALYVAALVEEVDIQDLNVRIEQTSNPAIRNVYTNLIAGSSNHLQAFASQFESRSGRTYIPQILSPEAVQEILSSQEGKGRGRRGGKGKGNF